MDHDSAPKPAGNVRWTIVFLVFVLIVMDYVDRGIITVSLPILKGEFSLTPILIAIIGSGFTYGYLIMNPVSGYILDKYGTRKTFSRLSMAWGAVQTVTAAAISSTFLVVARVLLGVTEAVGFPGVTKVTAEWLTRGEKARGGTISDSGVNVGIILGSVLMIGLVSIIPSSQAWRVGLLVSGILTMIVSVLLGKILYDSPEKHPKISKEELEYIRSNQDKHIDQVKISSSEWFIHRSYWGTMIGLGAQAGVFFGLFTWLPLYLSYARHVSLTYTLIYTAIIWSSGFVGEITGGFIIDHLNRTRGPNIGMKTGFAVSSIGVTLGLLGTIFANSAGMAIEILIVTFFFLRWSGIQWAVSSFLVPTRYAGQFGGHIGFWETLWGIGLPLLFGITVSLTNAYTEGMIIFVVVGLIYFLGSVVFTSYKPLKIAANGP
ncbi:MAG: MFS transporter [Candidatus Thermoplasmatota archaeon]|nr:MFS transporter [Candidatus Thermoplasmatota archaeon]MCL6090345.1 MFS transporter [Candidatus Thermoplasmatota archaeon]